MFKHLGPHHESDDYAEFVYFHTFVQEFLHQRPASDTAKPPPVRLLQATEPPAKLRVVLDCSDDNEAANGSLASTTVDVAIERHQIYLFEPNIAVLVVEVSAENLSVSTVQRLFDQLRRIYPPYWSQKESGPRAGHCPVQVEVRGTDDTAASFTTGTFDDEETFRRSAETSRRCDAIGAHWQYLLAPLEFRARSETGDIWHAAQFGDDRVPFLAYLAFDDPTRLTRADLVRLAFADPPGKPESMPYSPFALENFERDYCYDRYWRVGDDEYRGFTTRYMNCGYAFVMVGRHDADQGSKSFFSDEHSGGLNHFRRHYFRMGLIAHFQKAALLEISDELAESVKDFNPDDRSERKEFRNATRQIYENFLRFTQRFWFPEISAQLQANELFAMWRRHLGLQEMYEETRRQLQDVDQYLEMAEQARRADRADRWEMGGLILAIVALWLTAIGSNVPWPRSWATWCFLSEAWCGIVHPLAVGLVLAVFVSAIGLLLGCIVRKLWLHFMHRQ